MDILGALVRLVLIGGAVVAGMVAVYVIIVARRPVDQAN